MPPRKYKLKQRGKNIFSKIGDFISNTYNKAREIKPLTRLDGMLNTIGVRDKVKAIPLLGNALNVALEQGVKHGFGNRRMLPYIVDGGKKKQYRKKK